MYKKLDELEKEKGKLLDALIELYDDYKQGRSL